MMKRLPDPVNAEWRFDVFDFSNGIAVTLFVKFGQTHVKYATAIRGRHRDNFDCEKRRAKNMCGEQLKQRFWRYLGAA